MLPYHSNTFSSVQAHPLMWWVITPPSEGTMCSMSEYCYDSSHHGYSNHQRSGVYHPLQYSHIHVHSQWRSSTCWLMYPVSSLTVEHLHTGYKPSLVSTVVYLWHTVHRSRPHVHVTTDTNGLVCMIRGAGSYLLFTVQRRKKLHVANGWYLEKQSGHA